MQNPFLILAPMRGITTMHYRKAFVRHFGGLDAEMAPFITTVPAAKINPKLLKDVLPENNSGLPLTPQLLSKDADEFVNMTKALHGLGYEEVNWNLGCPHKPIRNKGRGSGLLPHPETVDQLLDQVCAESPCKISVKVRLGVADKSELLKLIPILNRHPLSEIIIHPRTAEQMYDGTVDLDAFAEAYQRIEHPVCYNGDIASLRFFQTLEAEFPTIGNWMLGRGLLANPFLCEQIKSGTPKTENAIPRLRAFHDEVFENYRSVIDGDLPMLGKMKEFWSYPAQNLSIRLHSATARQDARNFLKKVKKCHRLTTYQQILDEHLADAEWMA
jgi:tRNA-dihydrouridine synthase